MKKRISKIIFHLLLILSVNVPLMAFDSDSNDACNRETTLHEKPSQAPDKILVNPETRDDEIEKRLQSILHATNWFTNSMVEVENGVVFLKGETNHYKFKEWAEKLAHNTQDVAAVVNKIVVFEPSIMDLHMIMQELLRQGRKIIRSLPGIFFGGIILFLAWLAAQIAYKVVTYIFRDKVNSFLLHEVIARTIALFVFLMGVYFIFEMAELTTMALTVISGTGLLGIILGIAFRDLAENFLASVLLSLQNPFHTHDLIDLICPSSGYTITGYVECLTMRATILVSLDGNQVQIPNATVYKSNIVNHSTNPNQREAFSLNIETPYSISKAVDFALKVLLENEAILKNPEPLVLVGGLEKDSIKLEISYWIDIKKNNPSKVKSSVIRLIKQTFQVEGIYQTENDLLNSPKAAYSEDKPIEQYEAKTAKSEINTIGDSHIEKLKKLTSKSRLSETAENLLDKADKKNKKHKNNDIVE